MPERPGTPRSDPVAVIDIGSNSGRVMVFERDGSSHLRLLAGSRAPLRLVRDVDELAQLTEATMAHTMEAVRDFQAIATSIGAKRIVAVATAAMRDASNGVLFARRVERELGIRIEIIGGLAEARHGFAGAVRGLAVSNGLLFDLGGGSLQITRFARRRLVEAVSLPFGALRLSEKFLESDPPTGKQLRRLREHVRSRLAKARVGVLGSGERLVGTGGTLRNLAKGSTARRGTIPSAGCTRTTCRSIGSGRSSIGSRRPRRNGATKFPSSARSAPTRLSAGPPPFRRWRSSCAPKTSWCRVRACARASRSGS